MADFYQLLCSATADIHLVHCELQPDGQMLVGVAIVEASVTDDRAQVQAIAEPGLEVYEVVLPPQLVNNGHRYKAFGLTIPFRALP